MSARKALGLLSLLLLLGMLFTLPASTSAANSSPNHPLAKNNIARPNGDDGDTPQSGGSRKPPAETEEGGAFLEARDNYFLLPRLAGTQPLSVEEASAQLMDATTRTREMRATAPEALPKAYGGAWTAIGPNPIVTQHWWGSATFDAMSGRIGALTILPDGTRILGGAQGGIWTWDDGTQTWIPRTDDLGSLAIGALAYAPSNPSVVYAGTGEGALSGDSYAGNGILKSTDSGQTWTLVSGKQIVGQSTSAIVVDPNNADHVFIATIRGRGGNRRTTHPTKQPYGIYESTDGGATWNLLKGTTDEFAGATDLKMDPQNPNILYASFWGKGIFKSTDGGHSWNAIMNGLPTDAIYGAEPTRFALGFTHPNGQNPVLYTGFIYVDTNGQEIPSNVWKSTDEGASWTQVGQGTYPDAIENYCGSQCWYDNVILADPNDNQVVYVIGLYDYNIGAGGVFRSDDQGATWRNLGYDLHPDYHAIAINPSNTQEVMIGNDGGVWISEDRGGRPNSSDPLDATTWVNLNGTVNPNTASVTHSTNLQIAQYTSIANNPTLPGRTWGGTQDNGTLRHNTNGSIPVSFDVTAGDGGQVLVDPTDYHYVFGTYYGISPYRFTDGGGIYAGGYINNWSITGGIDLHDRSEFYIPMAMNQSNPDQLFLGTYRVYRTNNAKTTDPGDVLWEPISGDLTSGCSGPAPNGGRGCVISALAVSDGGQAVWAGTEEGYVWWSTNAVTGAKPTWRRVDRDMLPARPVQSIAVDRSNARRAVVAFGGFNTATPGHPGHVFLTNNNGKKWTDISGNLPNVPVNSVIMDPSYPNTFYIGTDVGPFVTNNGGVHWEPLGSGFPIVAVWQMDLDPANRSLLAGTHGRGGWQLIDSATQLPALVMSKTYPDTPVGPDTDITFSITVRNIGNADATGVTIKDKINGQNTFVSADNGGVKKKDTVIWQGLTIPAGGSITVSETWHISPLAKGKIKNRNYTVTSAEGVGAVGMPRVVKLAKPQATILSPQNQSGAGKPGQVIDYTITVKNLGYQPDAFKLKATGESFPTEIRDASCANLITQTNTIGAGATEDICIRVYTANSANKKNGQNSGKQNNQKNNNNAKQNTGKKNNQKQQQASNKPELQSVVTIQAQSIADKNVKATATITTLQVTKSILLVDEDGNNPDVQSYYTAALDAYGQPYDIWDLNANPVFPINYLNAHSTVIWFTGNTYPGPITPYESELTSFLNNGGNLFMSGQDILDQQAGTTTFVHDYLHINWDGSETQNDKPTNHVTSVNGNAVTNGIGTVPIDHSVLHNNPFEDQITPISPADPAFTDDSSATDALTVATNGYHVMFLAFPMEEYGNATQKADLISRFMNWVAP
jgi:uncharacterized repeat protein (TIGR01451 family)